MILLKKRDDGSIVPAFRGDALALEKIRPGATIVAENKTPPSAKLRRFYWALLGKIVDNHAFYADVMALHDVLRYGVQFYRVTPDHQMNLVTALRSTSDAECTWDEFKDYVDRAIDFVIAHILPTSKKDLIRSVEEMLGFSYKDALKGNRGKDTGELYDDGSPEP